MKTLFQKFINWCLYRNESHLSRNIRTTTNSYWRLDEQINDRYCDHYYCNRYSCKTYEKYDRVRRWLSIILKKRGLEKDLKFARYLDNQ